MYSDIRWVYFLIMFIAVAGILAIIGLDEHKVVNTVVAMLIFLAVYLFSLSLMIGLI